VEPITSFGIILVQILGLTKEEFTRRLQDDTAITGLETADFRFLMIRRKDSLGYIELLRGKYETNNREYILTLVEQTSMAERERLKTMDFPTLWEELWCGPVSKPYRHEFEPARAKFETIRSSFLGEVLEKATSRWHEPEWGFPKGRRGPGESELRCAMREFHEETRFPMENVLLCRNMVPLEESFFGSNKVHYRHKYYIALCFDPTVEPIFRQGDTVMAREIGDIRWFTLQEAMDHIRPYNVEKKEVLLHVMSVLRNFCFWIQILPFGSAGPSGVNTLCPV